MATPILKQFMVTRSPRASKRGHLKSFARIELAKSRTAALKQAAQNDPEHFDPKDVDYAAATAYMLVAQLTYAL